jgi:6-pyruvoyl-tetrahydropterin synthase
MFIARVERTISAAHHNGPPGSKCANNHGHDWHFVIRMIVYDEDLDEHGWGVDFTVIKQVLDLYDHKDLNEMFEPASAEIFARIIAENLQEVTKRWPLSVEVSEGNGNYMTWMADDASARI